MRELNYEAQYKNIKLNKGACPSSFGKKLCEDVLLNKFKVCQSGVTNKDDVNPFKEFIHNNEQTVAATFGSEFNKCLQIKGTMMGSRAIFKSISDKIANNGGTLHHGTC